jgi:hypothetical protein
MSESSAASGTPLAPHPGSPAMPRWNVGELPPAPRVSWRTIALLLGPGLVSGGAAIGAGEWLAGPAVTARYGAAMLWLATISILGQVVYNFEISRYTLYCGETIFTGKFRTLPGPKFWLIVYLVLDFGSVFPYAAAAAATPLAAVMLDRLPDAKSTEISYWILGVGLTDQQLMRSLAYVLFLCALTPLVIGGKVYNSLKALMMFKIVTVLGFLLVIAVLYSKADTWREIGSGFFKFGTIPVKAADAPTASGYATDNIFVSLWQGRGFPELDWSIVAMLAALASIAGSGGLTNTAISGYTRDQGWGMGKHVGAIPSAIGGHKFSLSHMGTAFLVTADSLRRWKGWIRHLARDQLIVWMPACFIGIALPSMLSVQFLARGEETNDWKVAVMTADGVRDTIGPEWGLFFWYGVMLCGFLVLSTTMASTGDGILRRWVDVFWTGSPRLQKWDAKGIRKLYFFVLCGYAGFGVTALTLMPEPGMLLKWAANIYNYALGFSCCHALYVNMSLLPKELQPGWFNRVCLVLAGVYFTTLAFMSTLVLSGIVKAAK